MLLSTASRIPGTLLFIIENSTKNMQCRRFYTPEDIRDTRITITEPRLLHKWSKVLRVNAGYECVLFNGFGSEYRVIIDELTADHAVLTVNERYEKPPIQPAVWLYVSLIKRNKFEWILEKTTELGVTGIVPLSADRSDKKGLKYDRAESISISASEQSGRAWLPKIGAIETVKDAISDLENSRAYCLDTYEKQDSLRLTEFDRSDLSLPVAVFIGPEGGWSDRERAYFQEARIPFMYLGDQNLKTETAVISITARICIG